MSWKDIVESKDEFKGGFCALGAAAAIINHMTKHNVKLKNKRGAVSCLMLKYPDLQYKKPQLFARLILQELNRRHVLLGEASQSLERCAYDLATRIIEEEGNPKEMPLFEWGYAHAMAKLQIGSIYSTGEEI